MSCLLQGNLQLWIPCLGEVYHSPQIPAGTFCKAHSPRLLVWASGEQALFLTHPTLNAGLAKRQGTSVKLWPQTTHFQPLQTPCAHQGTYAQRFGACLSHGTCEPRHRRELVHSANKKKEFGMKTGSGKVIFRDPLTLI